MKKITTLLLLLTSVLFSSAQQNNPYNQVGIDFASSFTTLYQDLTNKTITNLSQQTINHYDSILPSDINLNDTTALLIYQQTNNNLNLDSLIDNSHYSTLAQTDDLKQIVNFMYAQTSIDTVKAYLTLKTDSILNNISNYSSSDKVMLFSQIAIIYNNISVAEYVGRNPPDPNNPIPCSHASEMYAACVVGAGIAGYLIGNEICGTPCGIGGAIIFTVGAIIAYVTTC